MYKYNAANGYTTVTVITDRPVGEHKSAQAGIIDRPDGTHILMSYNTVVAAVYPDGSIDCTGLYSRTTIKHIGWFAREFGFTYYDFKKIVTER